MSRESDVDAVEGLFNGVGLKFPDDCADVEAACAAYQDVVGPWQQAMIRVHGKRRSNQIAAYVLAQHMLAAKSVYEETIR